MASCASVPIFRVMVRHRAKRAALMIRSLRSLITA
jgi:hypothetical protein